VSKVQIPYSAKEFNAQHQIFQQQFTVIQTIKKVWSLSIHYTLHQLSKHMVQSPSQPKNYGWQLISHSVGFWNSGNVAQSLAALNKW
jgi:hypothetical protein